VEDVISDSRMRWFSGRKREIRREHNRGMFGTHFGFGGLWGGEMDYQVVASKKRLKANEELNESMVGWCVCVGVGNVDVSRRGHSLDLL
jgi:hypothetical protein